jgi:hypothetical protein
MCLLDSNTAQIPEGTYLRGICIAHVTRFLMHYPPREYLHIAGCFYVDVVNTAYDAPVFIVVTPNVYT